MRTLLNWISFKIKYILTLIAGCVFVFIFVNHIITYSDASINSGKLFTVLAFLEVFLIIFISINLFSLVKGKSMLCINAATRQEDIYEYGNIINTISEGIIVVDCMGNIKNINQGLCNILGLEDKQLINKNLYINGYCRENKALIGVIIESLKTQKEFRQKEETLVRGLEVVNIDISTYILRNKKGSTIGVYAVIRDFTERKRLEQQLVHIENLTSTAQVAAELAHEIKNPICSIKGLIQILGRKQNLEDNKYYEVIINEIDKVSVMLERFLSLNQSCPKFVKVDIKKIMEEIIPLVDSYAESKSINVAVNIQKEIPFINVDKDNIRQVIVNIVQNGIDALPINGSMNISVWYDNIEELVKINFKDNGTGIKPEHMNRIFEPFFTTKVKGTGLGLAISHKIIEKHYGKLLAFNNSEGGATFVIELPTASRFESNDTEMI